VVTVTFKDNGVGIDVERCRENLFYPYKHFHTHVPGKGLGLYMVKSQVEAMKESIHIESAPEMGTTFIITFKKSF
jgi:signal transduction histidine kinase